MNITVKMLLMFSSLLVILVVACAVTERREGNGARYPGAVVGITEEEMRLHRQRLPILIYSDDHRRLVLLRSYLAGYYRGKPEQQKLEKLNIDNLKHRDVAWMCGLLTREAKPRPSRRYFPYFLAVVHRTSGAPEIKKAVQDAFDKEYSSVAKLKDATGGTKIQHRAALWSQLLSTLVFFGSADLLSPMFWEALEAEEFREGCVLLVHASPDVLAKLRSYKDKPVWKSPKLRERIKRLIRDVSLMLEYPALKGISRKYLPSLLEDLSQIVPHRRDAWLQRRLVGIKKSMEEDKKAAFEAASQPAQTKPTT